MADEKSLTIITPCTRPENLTKLKDSIQFDKVTLWYIIYDGKKIPFEKRFNHAKIIELNCEDEGISGNPNRNMGLRLINQGLVYFLDDDNIVHPQFWENQFALGTIYTFDQQRQNHVLSGNNPTVGNIDIAQYIFDIKLVGTAEFDKDIYEADGLFFEIIYKQNKDKWIYIPEPLCYYNFLV